MSEKIKLKKANQNKEVIYFPMDDYEIPKYIYSLIPDEDIPGAIEAKLLLNSLLGFIVNDCREIDKNPSFLLKILDIMSENMDEPSTDKLFMSLENRDGRTDMVRTYWVFRQSTYQPEALTLLYTIFTFYDMRFPEKLYCDDGKTLFKYPTYSSEHIAKIPEGVENISVNAFTNCGSLVEVWLPSTIKSVSGLSFNNCKNLNKVVIAKDNKHFYDIDGVLISRNPRNTICYYPAGRQDERYEIPSKVNGIAPFAFVDNEWLTNISLSSKRINIKNASFVNCWNLEKVDVISGNIKCEKRSFINCQLLENAPEFILASKVIDDGSEGLCFVLNEYGVPINQESPAAEPDEANDQIEEPEENVEKKMNYDLIPSEIKKVFDEYIIGHENAKKTLAVAVYTHFMRIKNPEEEIGKSNILMCGPTGCGKTEFARTIAKCMDVPFVTADATMITETGWKGCDPTDILKELYYKSNCDIEATEHGVVYIDEIDKLAVFGENEQREAFSKGVQQGLLKIIEGGDITIPADRLGMGDLVINTDNILFICGGAFSGIAEKCTNTQTMGFVTDKMPKEKQKDKKLESRDFVKYGMTQEFMGRFPIIIQLQELSEDDIFKILTEPKDSIVGQYTKAIRLAGAEVTFEDDLLREIARQAIKRGSGARGLRAVLENIIQDIIYEVPDNPNIKKVVVKKEVLTQNSKPTYLP